MLNQIKRNEIAFFLVKLRARVTPLTLFDRSERLKMCCYYFADALRSTRFRVRFLRLDPVT